MEPIDGTQNPGAALGALPPGPVVPRVWPVSGLYEHSATAPPAAAAEPLTPGPVCPPPPTLPRETLRLDVDGRYPQMTASGTLYRRAARRTHWVARLTKQADGSYTGPISYKEGDVSAFPYTSVTIAAVASPVPSRRTARVVFRARWAIRTRMLRWKSWYFRPCEIEYDTVAGAIRVTGFRTGSHPDRPPGLPVETITIKEVFRRAGIDVTKGGGDGTTPPVKAAPNTAWSDAEMHDAMQTDWSRFANKGQWSVWTLFASLHETGASRGGVMFDDVGPNRR